jgi:multiple sugar transport system permease protein
MRRRAEKLLPFTLVLPSMAFLAVLVLVPTFQVLYLSLVAEGGGDLGLENFRRMLADLSFSDALRNTLLLLIVLVPLQVALALVMALLINSRLRAHRWLQYVYMLPLAVSDLAAGILWLAVFTERGYLNSALQGVGIIDRPTLWLSFDNFAGLLTAIVIAESWRTTAIVLVILLAGLALIPRDLVETAELFGAGRVRRNLLVVLPLLRPSLRSALIVRTILALPIFAVVLVLAGRNMPVLAGEAYTWFANNRSEHIAAAYAVVILGLSVIGIVAYLRAYGMREAVVER